jgi:hypothetical protein
MMVFHLNQLLLMSMSFIDCYSKYAEGNEASPLFHQWGALSTLSAVMSRRIWFDQTYYKIYPNLYVVFVGEPGDKKTTAMTLARGFAQKADVPIAPPSITKEALTQLLSSSNEKSPFLKKFKMDKDGESFLVDAAHMAIFASEIVTMLSAGGNPVGMIEFLTDIYDREAFEVVTKNKGTDIIIGPYITMLACMTPEQTGQMLKQNIISGGFSRRCVFVYARSKPFGIAFPSLTEEQKNAKEQVLSMLKQVIEIKGEFTMEPSARDFFEEWYQKKHKQLMQPGPAALKNWLRSKDVIAIKVSMLLSISELRRDLIITKEHLTRAVKLLDAIEPDLGKVFAGAGRNISAELAEKILNHLRESPNKALPKKQILAMMFNEGTYTELTEAFNFLQETNQVQRSVNPGQNHIEILKIP